MRVIVRNLWNLEACLAKIWMKREIMSMSCYHLIDKNLIVTLKNKNYYWAFNKKVSQVPSQPSPPKPQMSNPNSKEE